MKRLLTAAATLATVLLTAVPAHAETSVVEDPAGDRNNRGLDITGVTLRNLEDRIVVDVAFVRSVRGDLIVSIDPRRARGLRLVSEYRPAARTRSYLAVGAFSDRHPGGAEELHCPGYRVRWSADEPTVRLVLPAGCLHGGDYDQVRFAVLTERGAADTDWAPDEAPASQWVARG